jgi:hypothetical protein
VQELELCIALYNSQLPVGQETVFDPEAKLFKGRLQGRIDTNVVLST